ncbi:hypothetical protein [uncultured Neptuniibacter sp.]|uniref:hypothetical protein n=1 Tax=uncultured Neptuniibacter sp. TaxID=502143 RepID=UPI00261DA1C3|nr:hypothetical protein [uncultured Neptuniibacter sp.]
MKLALAVVFLLLALSQLPFSKIRSILFGCVFASICSSLFIYPDYEFQGLLDLFIVLSIPAFFTALVFLLFPKVKCGIKVQPLLPEGGGGVVNLAYFLILIGVMGLLYNILLIYGGVGFIGESDVSITEYKNAGLAGDYLAQSALSKGSFVFRFFSLFAWLSLCLCFYYYLQGRILLACMLFFVSFNIPMLSMTGFSRSGLFYYVASLLLLFIRYYELFSRKQRLFLTVSILLALVMVLIVFSFITVSRFDGYSSWWVYVESGSDLDVITFSVLYYFGSWIDNTIHILREMEAPLLGGFNGYLSSMFFALKGLGVEVASKGELWESYFGYLSTQFLGLYLDTIYDAGSLGVFLVLLVFLLSYVFRRLYVRSLLVDCVFSLFFFQYFIMFFSGNVFSYFFVGMAFFVSLFVCFLIKAKFFRV